REAGVPHERVEHRRGPASKVLPHLCGGRRTRGCADRRVGRSHRLHRRSRHRPPGRGALIMAATLTARYIDAVTRSLAPNAQEDVRVELEASIADAVEARLEQGESPDAAERGVLTELGDPAALA